MTLQIITFLTVPDSSAGRAAFVAAANQFGDDLTPFANEANALAVEVNDNAVSAAASKTDAQTAQGLAEAARDAALSASTAVAADYDPLGHSYEKNDLAWDAPGELYRCIQAYVSDPTTPSADAVHWARVNLTPDDVSALYAAVNSQLDVPGIAKSTAYTLALADRGRSIDTTANVTVPASTVVAFPVGAVVMVTNTSGVNISILAAAGVTLRLVATTKTGTRTLAGYSVATMRQVALDVWYIMGTGLS